MRYYSILIFLLLSICQVNRSSANDTLKLNVEYLKVREQAYFEPIKIKQACLHIKAAGILKTIGEFEKAALLLNSEVNVNSLPDTIKADYYFELALLSLLMDQPQQCLFNLYLMGSERSYRVIEVKMLALTSLKNHKDLETIINSNYNGNQHEMLSEWLKSYQTVKFKDPLRAEWYSTFIPGWGQTYAGEFGEGLTSFALNAGSLVFMGYNFWVTRYITTFTLGSGLLEKFYSGGRRRSVILATGYNENLKKDYTVKLINILNKKRGE